MAIDLQPASGVLAGFPFPHCDYRGHQAKGRRIHPLQLAIAVCNPLILLFHRNAVFHQMARSIPLRGELGRLLSPRPGRYDRRAAGSRQPVAGVVRIVSFVRNQLWRGPPLANAGSATHSAVLPGGTANLTRSPIASTSVTILAFPPPRLRPVAWTPGLTAGASPLGAQFPC